MSKGPEAGRHSVLTKKVSQKSHQGQCTEEMRTKDRTPKRTQLTDEQRGKKPTRKSEKERPER